MAFRFFHQKFSKTVVKNRKYSVNTTPCESLFAMTDWGFKKTEGKRKKHKTLAQDHFYGKENLSAQS